MFKPTLLVLATIAVTSVGIVHGQGRSGRSGAASNRQTTQDTSQRRVQAQTNQRIQQQVQRQATLGGSRAVHRKAVALERAAQVAARRSAHDVASQQAGNRQFADSVGVRSETVAAKAAMQANLHAIIAAGLVTGKPLHFTEGQRGLVTDVFGDAGLLESRTENRSNEDVAQTGFTENTPKTEQSTSPRTGRKQPNVRARLANAIRVRRAQISELRDRAIDSGDTKLLDRADRLERTLDLFLQNQSRVESKLAEASGPRGSTMPALIDPIGTPTADAAPRVADTIPDTESTNEPSNHRDTRLE